MKKSFNHNKTQDENVSGRKSIYVEDYVHSSLFNDVYVLKDLPIDFPKLFGDRDDDAFGVFRKMFTDLISQYTPSERAKWGHADTVRLWIKPILSMLGWSKSFGDQAFVENTPISALSPEGDEVSLRPSIVIVQDPQAREIVVGSRHSDRAQKEINLYAEMVVATAYFNAWADQKAEGRYSHSKDEVGLRGDVFSSLGPNLQALKYLVLMNQEWSIATDGATWRIFKRSASIKNPDRFYEFNLQRIADDFRTTKVDGEVRQLSNALKYFFYFFSYESFLAKPVPLLFEVSENAKRYMPDLKDDIKGRFVAAMTIACNGYWTSYRESHGSKPDLQVLRNTAESFVFNLLFLRSCESNRILPLHQDYLPLSLSYLVRKIGDFNPEKEWAENKVILEKRLASICGPTLRDDGREIYEFILRLHKLIQKGTGKGNDFGFQIAGFKETLFSKVEEKFFLAEAIGNRNMIRLLFELTYLESSTSGAYQEIPYAYFSPKQLGSIYESFLEFKLTPIGKSDGAQYYVKKRIKDKITWSWIEEDKVPKSANRKAILCIKPGGLMFSPSDERKSSGAFYTPDEIVERVVMRTLGPLVKGKSPEEIIEMRVCDPAMGSGHFLLSALNFLAEAYQSSLKEQQQDFFDVKRRILDACIFGVDINHRAVKLAKMSLWLSTAQPGRKLERLDDQLKCGDSLISNMESYDGNFDWQKEIFRPKKIPGFDAIVGNPPYLSMKKFPKSGDWTRVKDHCLGNFSTFERKGDYYCCFVERALSTNGLLRDGGICGFVLSKTFFSEPSFEKFRAMLLENQIKQIDLNDPDAFGSVNIRTANIVVARVATNNDYDIPFGRQRQSGYVSIGVGSKVEFGHLNKIVADPCDDNLRILRKIGLLRVDPKFTTVEGIVCGESEDRSETHGGFKNGVATGDNDYWVVRASSKKEATDLFLDMGHKELNVCKYYHGSTIQPFCTTWGGYWVNYVPEEMSRHSIAKNRGLGRGSDASRARTFYYDRKDPLYKRECGIINSLVSRDIKCDVFTKKEFWDIGINILFIGDDEISPHALCGILNSKLVSSYILANLRSNPNITQDTLKRIPIPKMDRNQVNTLERLVIKLKGLQGNSEKLYLRTLAELNDAVYQMYGLTKQEIAWVEGYQAQDEGIDSDAA